MEADKTNDQLRAEVERLKPYEEIAFRWNKAADEGRQPDKFYEEYSEATMRAMQALLAEAQADAEHFKQQAGEQRSLKLAAQADAERLAKLVERSLREGAYSLDEDINTEAHEAIAAHDAMKGTK